jgi:hypothetical protein
MTKDTSDLARRLEPFLANIAEYRASAKMLATLGAQEAHQVSNEVLLKVEEISEDIGSDIVRLAELIKSLRGPTAADLALITEAEDALRLVLLEVTETGTKLYSARSLGA